MEKKVNNVKNNAQLSKELKELREFLETNSTGCQCTGDAGVTPLIKFKSEIPFKKHKGDAGFDLVSTHGYTIGVGHSHVFKTGCFVEIPEGYVGLVKGRSSLGITKKILTFGGVIDSNYRGEIKVTLFNNNNCFHTVNAGDRIAQLVIVPCLTNAVAVKELSGSDRGDQGFGSTDK